MLMASCGTSWLGRGACFALPRLLSVQSPSTASAPATAKTCTIRRFVYKPAVRMTPAQVLASSIADWVAPSTATVCLAFCSIC